MATSGADYGYDGAGRLSNYEGALPGLNSTFPAYMPKYSNYTFNANGNVTARPGQSLVWDVQNRLAQVTGGTTETYLYDPDGQRVKKTVGSTVSLYPFAHYEITAPQGLPTVTKYYFFAGMRVAMKQGSTLTYLHSDHLGSTVLETNTSGTPTADQKYRAYGKQRDTGAVVTDHKFTGQKLDGTGLQYYNARYYDPAIGVFISPDTLVPDATNVFGYNRYMFVRGNPLNRVDPTGHADIAMDDGYNKGTIQAILRMTGVTSNNEERTAAAVNDFAQKVGSLAALNTLLNGATNKTTNVEIKPSNLMQLSGRVGEPYTGCTYDACEPESHGSIVYANSDYDKTKSLVVHELAHVIDEQTSIKGCWIRCSLSAQYPEERGSDSLYTSPSGNILNPIKEDFAKGVATWVYGGKTYAGQGYPLAQDQREFLNDELRGR